MVVDDAGHIVAIAEVTLEEAQDMLCRPAGTNQDDWLIEEVAPLEDCAQHIAGKKDQQQHQDAE